MNPSQPKVFITKAVTPDGLMACYRALGRVPSGRTAVKLSTGEPGGHNFLQPGLIAPLVREVGGAIVECNTAYQGKRFTTAEHYKTAERHGFTAIAPVDIQDADGDTALPVTGGARLRENYVGSHFSAYDFYLVLSHFKGHAMGGFGGAVKNLSIGLASSRGKSLIHSAGTESTGFGVNTPQDHFLESMAEAAKSVTDALSRGERALYINVMNRLSVDCDCDSNPAEPEMKDIGILSSLDPVALDQACVDLVYAAPDGRALIERIESRNGSHTLEYAEAVGLGSRRYELVSLDA